jgi:hypothetical protein
VKRFIIGVWLKNSLIFIWYLKYVVLPLMYQKRLIMFKTTNLLTTANFKTIKGEKKGYRTYIMYLSSYTDNSRGINLCSHASAGCASACLVNSGFGGMYQKVKEGRRNKAEWFIANRDEFLAKLDTEITSIERRHSNLDKVCIRLNGTSDIRWEKFKIRDGKNIFELHPGVQFYDYTKNPLRFNIDLPLNYHLTFSRSETNEVDALRLLSRGFNVAMVFRTLPKEYKGFKVINGMRTI